MAATLTLLAATGLLLLVGPRVAPMPSMFLVPANGTRPSYVGWFTGASAVVVLLSAGTVLAAGAGTVAGWAPAPTTTTIRSTPYDIISTVVVGTGDVGDVKAGSGRPSGETSGHSVASWGELQAPRAPNIVRHGPINPGPLADDVAATFRSGTYNAVTSSEPTTLYRVFSDPARQVGPYWTRTAPTGPTQSIIDSALDPMWGSRDTSWVQIRVPRGTTFYEGAAAAQRGLVGGGNQVFLPWVDDAWIVGGGGF